MGTVMSSCLLLYFSLVTMTCSVFQRATLPQVLPVCQMLPANLTYYGVHSSTASLRSTLFCYNHQMPLTTRCVSVFVSRSKCLLCVDYVLQRKVNWYFMLYQVSLYLYWRKSWSMVPSVLRRGEFMWYFSLPSTSLTREYLWLLVSVSYRTGLALPDSV